MSQDISGFGLQVRVIASNTYPVGISITQLADDTDPFDLPTLEIGDSAMGVNGDLVSWSKANPIPLNISVVPNGPDDIALSALLEANRVGKGKRGARDEITIVAIYPDGRVITFTKGKIISGMPGNSVASAGRMKSKPYSFKFENRVGV